MRAIEMMRKLHQEAMDGKLGPAMQLVAEQGVIATNELIYKLMERFDQDSKNIKSLRRSLDYKKAKAEMAQMSVAMTELAIQAAEAMQQCGTSSTDSASKKSTADDKESESSAVPTSTTQEPPPKG